MIRCAVCDDETLFRERVTMGIQEYAKTKKITCSIDAFSGGEELLNAPKLNYDVYFLDIQMQEIDGMELAGMIREKNDRAVIVFISGYIQYASRGYRVNAIRYILKSQFDEEFPDCMDAVMAKLEINEEVLEIKVDTKQVLVKISEIRFIENVKRKVFIHMKGQGKTVYETYAKITELAEELHDLGFIYCHLAYLVQAKEIAEITPSEFVLFSGEKIPISRQRYAQAQKEYYFNKTKSNTFG